MDRAPAVLGAGVPPDLAPGDQPRRRQRWSIPISFPPMTESSGPVYGAGAGAGAGSGTGAGTGTGAAAKAGSAVLLILASGQFLMTLDSSVMNVSIKSVANDLGTTVTGIQTAITLYTLVMAAFMITGGKIGALIGRRRAFAVGLVIYGFGSLITALAPNLTVLIIGWSVLEGLGAALIMPAIVALVAGNFPQERRSAAYGLIAAAGAIAVAAGPLIGGAVTTFASWRWVFVGEVVIVAVILVGLRTDPRQPARGPGGVRPVRGGPVRRRALPDGLRRPALRRVGVRPAQARGTRRARRVAGGLAGPGRPAGDRRPAGLGEPSGARGAASRCSVRPCSTMCR